MDAQRIAANEALFREINEQIKSIHADLYVDDPEGRTLGILCECAAVRCQQRLTIEVDEYEAVRRHSQRFIVMRGHEIPDVARTIAQRDGYLIVEKLAEAGKIDDLR